MIDKAVLVTMFNRSDTCLSVSHFYIKIWAKLVEMKSQKDVELEEIPR